MSNWFNFPSGGSGTASTTTSTIAGQLQPYLNNYYNPTPIVPPTLPIKLGMRELVKLAQVMDADPELHEIIKKFQPWIGVEV